MAPLIRVTSAESTMDLLHDLASDGAEAGTVVVAGEQTGGRGSRGRSWRSPPGGLWLSALYRPLARPGLELLSLRVGLAVVEAVDAVVPDVPVRLKWPNDVMVGDRKVGGILCEARWQGDALVWIVAGVGINVANTIPSELSSIAAALVEWVPGLDPERLEREVVPRLLGIAPSPDRLTGDELAALRRRDWLVGRVLRGPVPGRAAGISDTGALLVRSEGRLVSVTAGTVELAGPLLES